MLLYEQLSEPLVSCFFCISLYKDFEFYFFGVAFIVHSYNPKGKVFDPGKTLRGQRLDKGMTRRGPWETQRLG